MTAKRRAGFRVRQRVGEIGFYIAKFAAAVITHARETVREHRLLAQQRLAALIASLGSTSRTLLGTNTDTLDLLKTLATSNSSLATVSARITDALLAVRRQSVGFRNNLQTLASSLDISALPIASVMGSWAFAQDQTTVINTQTALVANFDVQQTRAQQALQQISIGDAGSVRPDALATSASGKALRGSQAMATLLAQSLASLDAAGQALASIDPDAALFVDPSATPSKALRDLGAVPNPAPRISLRQLGSQFQPVAGKPTGRA
jgi:hypothetical protein